MVNQLQHLPEPTSPRQDARVTLADGRVFSAPIGTPLRDYIQAAYPEPGADGWVVAAIINNELHELTQTVHHDVTVAPLTLGESEGERVYRQSLVLLLITAVAELFPGIKINVNHSIPIGGFYCSVVGREPFTTDELKRIMARMRAIAQEDAAIVRTEMPMDKAIAYFEARREDDKLRLLRSRKRDCLTVYQLHDTVEYLFGHLTASTGALKYFDLIAASRSDGFILLFPRTGDHGRLPDYRESRKLEDVFLRTRKWLDVMQIEDIGRLNQAIAEKRIREEVLIAEALQTRYIAEIAAMIAERHAAGVRLVLIAGPSSAGKTTFSKRLAVQLMAYGIRPFTLEMDNYYVDRDLTPRDDTGAYDFEALNALNLERLNGDVLKFMQRVQVQMPRYDFKLGKSLPGDTVRLTDDHIIVAEGIHGLNPGLMAGVPQERIVRIYVSALTTLNIDRHNRVPTTDVRLLRRMVRDSTQRGHSAQETLDRWESVQRGEKRNIFPYQENADVMFNSSLFYELAVLRPYAEPLLRQIEHTSPRYIEAKRLLALLSWIRPAKAKYVPSDSLLREFIGGSILETYTPGTMKLP
ncbi:MAG TPA: hypothetical protein VMT34_01805 [Aggregatilineales bacterium]|nr:hypothetical protein [Aggregatilineales bacterium]